MTTLTLLKQRIADDIARSDLTSQIANSITDAIEHYKSTRFYFNEVRTSTFATVAAQDTYTVDDDADIPLFIELDAVFVNDGTSEFELTWTSPAEIQWLLDNSASSTRPRLYSYFEESFRLYPIPDAVYTIRPIGLIEKAAPATDGEANNVWCVEAFELIRCRAKLYLYTHVIMDAEMASLMVAAEAQAYRKLRRHTTMKQSGGVIQPTQF